MSSLSSVSCVLKSGSPRRDLVPNWGGQPDLPFKASGPPAWRKNQGDVVHVNVTNEVLRLGQNAWRRLFLRHNNPLLKGVFCGILLSSSTLFLWAQEPPRPTSPLSDQFADAAGEAFAPPSDADYLETALEDASVEFDVPLEMLRGIVFVVMHYRQQPSDSLTARYGPLGLTDDDHSHSLQDAAWLIAEDPSVLKSDPIANVRGGAALLSSLVNEARRGGTIVDARTETWGTVVKGYCDTTLPELGDDCVGDVLAAVSDGFASEGVVLPNTHPELVDVAYAWPLSSPSVAQVYGCRKCLPVGVCSGNGLVCNNPGGACSLPGTGTCVANTTPRYNSGVNVHTGVDVGGMPGGSPVNASAAGDVVAVVGLALCVQGGAAESIYLWSDANSNRRFDSGEEEGVCSGNGLACTNPDGACSLPGTGTCGPVPTGRTRNNHGLGMTVVVQHSDGRYSLYGHLAAVRKDIYQRVVGQGLSFAVAQGEAVGLLGFSTCDTRRSTNTHVHFEIKDHPTLGNMSDDGDYWGYTPGHPDLYGYRDPRLLIEGIAVADVSPLSVRKPPPGALNVRSSPGTASSGTSRSVVIDQIGENQEYVAFKRAFSESRWWYFIHLPSTNSPIDGSHPNNGAAGGWVADTVVPDSSAATVQVLTDSQRVQGGPSDAFVPIAKVYNADWFVTFGTPTPGSGCRTAWYKIYVPGDQNILFSGPSEGWVCGDYLIPGEVMAADLRETVVSNPPVSAAGCTSFPVTHTVLNAGTAAAGSTTTRFYLSADTVRGGADVLLLGTSLLPTLTPGQSSSGTVSVTIPCDTFPGFYYLLACADDLRVVAESNEGNNCRASTSQVQIPLPNLQETALTNPPTNAAVCTSFPVTDTVSNVGGGAAGASRTRYYLSTDTVKGSTDILLSTYRLIGTLAVGGTFTGTRTVAVPCTTPPGNYYLLACADDLLQVTESNESDNCRSSTSTVQVTAGGS